MTRERKRPSGAPTAATSQAAPAPATTGYLTSLAAAADKQYGSGTMTTAVNAFSFMRYIPFGHLVGDLCLLGGLPEGRAAMFLGREGGGKTTQAMRCVAQAQRKYPHHHAIWVDTEQTFDPLWARSHGVDLDRLTLVSTVTGEDAADLMKTAVANAEELCFLVLDSVNQMTPMKEYNDSIGDTQVALSSRLMGRLCSHLTSASAERRAKGWLPVTQIFVNQWRSTIGGPPRMDNKVIPGGTQLKHYCSTHIEFKAKVVQERDGTENSKPYIVEHVFNVRRAKGPASIREGEYSVVVGPDHPLPIGSYDEAGTILSQAKKIGLWTGAGTSQRFEGYDPVFRKMDEGIEWLENNPDAALEIKRAILMHHRRIVNLTEVPPDGYLLRWR